MSGSIQSTHKLPTLMWKFIFLFTVIDFIFSHERGDSREMSGRIWSSISRALRLTSQLCGHSSQKTLNLKLVSVNQFLTSLPVFVITRFCSTLPTNMQTMKCTQRPWTATRSLWRTKCSVTQVSTWLNFALITDVFAYLCTHEATAEAGRKPENLVFSMVIFLTVILVRQCSIEVHIWRGYYSGVLLYFFWLKQCLVNWINSNEKSPFFSILNYSW